MSVGLSAEERLCLKLSEGVSESSAVCVSDCVCECG